MNTILNLIKQYLNPTQASMLEEEPVMQKVNVHPPVPLDIYQDLPDIGNDREKILKMIVKQFPEGPLYPERLVRHNRRALYNSIHFLRTASKRQWMLDIAVNKGEYTTDKLVRVATQQREAFQPA